MQKYARVGWYYVITARETAKRKEETNMSRGTAALIGGGVSLLNPLIGFGVCIVLNMRV